jgi:hypothetical protein
MGVGHCPDPAVTDLMPAVLAVAVLAAMTLMGAGSWALFQRDANRLKAWLMVGAGAVTLLNVWLAAG